MIANATDHETLTRRASLALIAAYNDTVPHYTALDAMKARQLLGKIDSVDMGQGAFNLLIPAQALRDAGVNFSLWETGDFNRRHDAFEVPYDMAVIGILPLLEEWAQQKWPEARALYAQVHGEGDQQDKGNRR